MKARVTSERDRKNVAEALELNEKSLPFAAVDVAETFGANDVIHYGAIVIFQTTQRQADDLALIIATRLSDGPFGQPTAWPDRDIEEGSFQR